MASRIVGIYMITSPSGRFYIGQSKDILSRFRTYQKGNISDQPKLYNSFLKHGIPQHKFTILEVCKPDQLDEREDFYIVFFQTVKNGLNCKGGGHRATLSQESRQKLSESLKRTNRKQEVKERRSAWQRGRKMSEEAIEKMRTAKAGKPGHPNQKQAALKNNNACKGLIQIFKDGTLVDTKENIYKAAEFIGGNPKNISRALTHPTKKRHKGFEFKRIKTA